MKPYLHRRRLSSTLRLLQTFYRAFFFASLAVTICCLCIFWKYGFSVFAGVFWLKIVTLFLSWYFVNSYKKREYYYYQNLGISKRLLWTSTLIFDFGLFILLINLIHQFR